ncbi:hypothetical protein [Crenobacter cavernae]|uniref:Uncharacterized protein n=1 Tax=Crenobacter cavernae TaxID=2290923 RepID=A0A345Y7V7_9NEIS|nr:hypothetical protein [Crenobacter cavernae]AXK40009.1 hypothetical protein DWG20_11465 [Crenobacter cavernae]
MTDAQKTDWDALDLPVLTDLAEPAPATPAALPELPLDLPDFADVLAELPPLAGAAPSFDAPPLEIELPPELALDDGLGDAAAPDLPPPAFALQPLPSLDLALGEAAELKLEDVLPDWFATSGPAAPLAPEEDFAFELAARSAPPGAGESSSAPGDVPASAAVAGPALSLPPELDIDALLAEPSANVAPAANPSRPAVPVLQEALAPVENAASGVSGLESPTMDKRPLWEELPELDALTASGAAMPSQPVGAGDVRMPADSPATLAEPRGEAVAEAEEPAHPLASIDVDSLPRGVLGRSRLDDDPMAALKARLAALRANLDRIGTAPVQPEPPALPEATLAAPAVPAGADEERATDGLHDAVEPLPDAVLGEPAAEPASPLPNDDRPGSGLSEAVSTVSDAAVPGVLGFTENISAAAPEPFAVADAVATHEPQAGASAWPAPEESVQEASPAEVGIEHAVDANERVSESAVFEALAVPAAFACETPPFDSLSPSGDSAVAAEAAVADETEAIDLPWRDESRVENGAASPAAGAVDRLDAAEQAGSAEPRAECAEALAEPIAASVLPGPVESDQAVPAETASFADAAATTSAEPAADPLEPKTPDGAAEGVIPALAAAAALGGLAAAEPSTLAAAEPPEPAAAPATVVAEAALVDALYQHLLPRMKMEMGLWLQEALEAQTRQLLSGVMAQLKQDYDMMFGETLRESLRQAINEVGRADKEGH